MGMTLVSDPDVVPQLQVTEVIAPAVSTTEANTWTGSPAAGAAGEVRMFAMTGPGGGGAEPLCVPGLACVTVVMAVKVHSVET